MRRGRAFLVFCLFFGSLSLVAAGNGLNLNSHGTKALSMGGAFVGLASDYSAIYWNPAAMGFFQQKYLGFYGTDIIPSGSYRLGYTMPSGYIHLVDAKTERKHYLGGLLAYYHPISDKFIAGLGVYTTSGLGAEWHGADLGYLANGNPGINWRSKIGIITISPGLAYRISDLISVGLTFNINYGMFDLAMHAGTVENVGTQDLGQYTESSKGWGYGTTIGLLLKPADFLSLGLTFRTASTVKFSGTASISNLQAVNLGAEPINSSSALEREITWPIWVAGGVAFYPTARLTLTADIQYTQWSHKKNVAYGSSDINAGTGGYLKADYLDDFWKLSGTSLRPLFWDDTVQIGFGIEYRIKALAIRAGYRLDPSPAPDRTMNILFPSFDFNVFTAGFGYHFNRLQIDVGFEYLRGRERDIPLWKTADYPPLWPDAMAGIHKLSAVVPAIALSYSF